MRRKYFFNPKKRGHTMKALKNVNLYGEITDILIDGGKITAIGKTDEDGVDFGGARIYPGLIDIHSHGAIGRDTMDGDLAEMARYYLSIGVTTWYPTTMTMSEEDIIRATNADTEIEGGANIPGFHMEGPFINVKCKGAQNERFIVPPSMEMFSRCRGLKMVTVAPEIEGAIDFISECPAVISLGHTDTDYDTAAEAFRRGARCLTHTFNAMPAIHHRAPGPIPAGAEYGAYAQIICDGVHVHPSVVKMLISMYGTDRVIIISDSMRATGLGDGEYEFGGQKITVTDGKAYTEGGALAGSTTNLFECVRRAIGFGIPERDAVKMATENPATLMGLNKGKIEVGYDADFIIVDDDFRLIRAIARGEL